MSPSELLKWSGERRDGFLVIGAAVYGLGYLVWSFNAWWYELGQLPALEFQYIVSGLFPAFVLGLAVAAVKWFPEMQMAVRTHKSWSLWTNILFYIPFCITLYHIAVAVLSALATVGYIGQSWTLPSLPNNVVNIATFLTFTSGFLLDFKNKVFSKAFLVIFAAFLSYQLINIYVVNYNNLPQLLGGPKPRCAYVDLVRSEISPSSLDAFAAGSSANETEQYPSNIVRSVRLLVYSSSGGDYLLVRKAAEPNALKEAPLYELRKEVIRVIEWCAERDKAGGLFVPAGW